MSEAANPDPGDDQVLDIARGHMYSFLASAWSDPARSHFDLALDGDRQTVAIAAAQMLRSAAPARMELAAGERVPNELNLRRVVRELQAPRPHLVGNHQRVFGLLIGKTAPLNETEYCRSTDSFYRAQQLADVAGFYRAFGLVQDGQRHERQDHVSVELDFMAHLIGKEITAASSPDRDLNEKAKLCRAAQRTFFEAHVAWWTPAFAALIGKESQHGLYAALADVLSSFVPGERHRLAVPRSAKAGRPPGEAQTTGDGDGCVSIRQV